MKRRSVLVAVLSLVLAVSLLTAPALADKGKEPQGKGKQQTEQGDSGFDYSVLAKITALGGATGAVVGCVVGVCRRHRGEGRGAKTAPVRACYYRPAAKGETCGRMPEGWGEEDTPVREMPAAFAFGEEASPWPQSPVEEAPPAPMEEPAPVHPTVQDSPFEAFDEVYDDFVTPEEHLDEEPEDEEPGEVNFKI